MEIISTNRFLKVAKENMSNNNEIKCEAVLKLFAKLSKKQKDNDYVAARDMAVFGLLLLGLFKETLDSAHTTAAGRKDLQQLHDEIFRFEPKGGKEIGK